MLEKIALATALLAAASFATWDKFPVLDNHKGNAEVGVAYGVSGDVSALEMTGGARYGAVPGFEMGILFPAVLYSEVDGERGPDGPGNVQLMFRRQFHPAANVFLDLALPVGSRGVADDGYSFHFGMQYSRNFGAVDFGSEAGFEFHTDGKDKLSAPYNLVLGGEARIPMGAVVPYFGVDFDMWVGELTYDGKKIFNSDVSGTIGAIPYVGAKVAFSESFYVDVSVRCGLGEEMYGEDTPITLEGKFGVNF